jgi:SpoVK/Ycf46/Vps4 family AAA+-type ATPase
MKEKILNQLIDRIDDLELKYLKLQKSIKKNNNNNNESILSIFQNLDINPKKKNNNNNNRIISDDSDDDINMDINFNDVIYNINTAKNNNSDILKNDNCFLKIKTIINKNQIDSLDDFIKINDYYQKNKMVYKFNKKYDTLNLKKIEKIINPLIKLKKMVGLDKIKDEIINFILYYLIYTKKNENNEPSHMKHISIEGSPGCGKTKLAKIISKILIGLGILENNKIVYAKRTDLIGTHLGETGKKTQNIINKALGGVLFIDEAYSLGCDEKKDIFSKECIDIITQNLSDNKSKFVCIIAGYTEELESSFFSVNPGLVRRFPFRFKIEKYTYQELRDIFIRKIYKLNWKIHTDIDNINKVFENNYKYFKYFGGDIDTFIQDIKYCHARRIVCSNVDEFKIINIDDITTAMDKFINRRTIKENNNYEKMYI